MIEDGLYLFVYSEINPVLNVLGHSLRHDHNMALFKKQGMHVELVFHTELERFSGIKHHNVAFYDKKEAREYISEVLESFDICMDDLRGVYGVPGLDDNEKLDYSSLISDSGFSYHAISHLYTSMLDTEKIMNNDMISLAYDGGPDSLIDEKVFQKPLFCGCVSRKGKISYFPISSPGGYWLYVSNIFGMPEGTLMALAYASEVRSLESFDTFPDYVYSSDKKKCMKALDFVINRIMSYKKEDKGILFSDYDDRFSFEEIKISMIMKIIQEKSIENVFLQIDRILEKYELNPNETIISLSGGYALNCPTNFDIMDRYKFKEMMCAPCVNDGGLSIGMGLYFFKKFMDSFIYKFEGAFYGYDDRKNFADTVDIYRDYISDVSENVKKISDDILKSPILWLDGNAEIGPRALGHRSIIADARNKDHKDLLNIYKQREWWRPVAPIVLAEDIGDWFEDSYLSPYMLHNFTVKAEKAEIIPAVLHFDLTARVQSLKREDNESLYNVIREIKEKTNVPIVCNTSMNDKGEPIINTLAEAINFALRKKIGIIYAYGHRIVLKNHDLYTEMKWLKRNDWPFVNHRRDRECVMKKYNPFRLPYQDFLVYMFNPQLRKMDITKEKDYKKVESMIKKMKLLGSNLIIFEEWGKKIGEGDIEA